MGNAGSGNSRSSFYRGLLEAQCDDALGETLVFDDGQLTGLFRWIFGPESPWITSKVPWPSSVTEESYQFVISSQAMAPITHIYTQDASRTGKPFCTQLHNAPKFLSCEFTLNTCCHSWEVCLPS